METKFSKEKWIVNPDKTAMVNVGDWITIEQKYQWPGCLLSESQMIEQSNANAKLIAAAPKLYEMLNKILNIEDHTFRLKEFNIKRLKSEISTLLNKATL